jgi:hypothetical protein
MTKSRNISKIVNTGINVSNTFYVGNSTVNVTCNSTFITINDTNNSTVINSTAISAKSINAGGTLGSNNDILSKNSTSAIWKSGPLGGITSININGNILTPSSNGSIGAVVNNSTGSYIGIAPSFLVFNSRTSFANGITTVSGYNNAGNLVYSNNVLGSNTFRIVIGNGITVSNNGGSNAILKTAYNSPLPSLSSGYFVQLLYYKTTPSTTYYLVQGRAVSYGGGSSGTFRYNFINCYSVSAISNSALNFSTGAANSSWTFFSSSGSAVSSNLSSSSLIAFEYFNNYGTISPFPTFPTSPSNACGGVLFKYQYYDFSTGNTSGLSINSSLLPSYSSFGGSIGSWSYSNYISHNIYFDNFDYKYPLISTSF